LNSNRKIIEKFQRYHRKNLVLIDNVDVVKLLQRQCNDIITIVKSYRIRALDIVIVDDSVEIPIFFSRCFYRWSTTKPYSAHHFNINTYIEINIIIFTASLISLIIVLIAALYSNKHILRKYRTTAAKNEDNIMTQQWQLKCL